MLQQSSEKLQYHIYKKQHNFDQHWVLIENNFRICNAPVLDILKVAEAIFHENLSKQQTMATSSPQPFPNKKIYPMLREIAQIATAKSGVSSFNFSSCRLTDDDDSESQALVRDTVAGHIDLIQKLAQQIHHPSPWIKNESVSEELEHCLEMYFTRYRTFDPEDFTALINYMEMTADKRRALNELVKAYFQACFKDTTQLPEMTCESIFMIVCILEQHSPLCKSQNIQHAISNAIQAYGITDLRSPASFSFSISKFLRTAQKLRSTINHEFLLTQLLQHFETTALFPALTTLAVIFSAQTTDKTLSVFLDRLSTQPQRSACPELVVSDPTLVRALHAGRPLTEGQLHQHEQQAKQMLRRSEATGAGPQRNIDANSKSTRIDPTPRYVPTPSTNLSRLPRYIWITLTKEQQERFKAERNPSGRGDQSTASNHRGGHGARGLQAPRSSDRYNDGNFDHPFPTRSHGVDNRSGFDGFRGRGQRHNHDNGPTQSYPSEPNHRGGYGPPRSSVMYERYDSSPSPGHSGGYYPTQDRTNRASSAYNDHQEHYYAEPPPRDQRPDHYPPQAQPRLSGHDGASGGGRGDRSGPPRPETSVRTDAPPFANTTYSQHNDTRELHNFRPINQQSVSQGPSLERTEQQFRPLQPSTTFEDPPVERSGDYRQYQTSPSVSSLQSGHGAHAVRLNSTHTDSHELSADFFGSIAAKDLSNFRDSTTLGPSTPHRACPVRIAPTSSRDDLLTFDADLLLEIPANSTAISVVIQQHRIFFDAPSAERSVRLATAIFGDLPKHLNTDDDAPIRNWLQRRHNVLKQDLDQVLLSIDWSDELKDRIYEALDIALKLQFQEHLPDDDNDDLGSSCSHLTVSDDSSMDSYTLSYHQNETLSQFLKTRRNDINDTAQYTSLHTFDDLDNGSDLAGTAATAYDQISGSQVPTHCTADDHLYGHSLHIDDEGSFSFGDIGIFDADNRYDNHLDTDDDGTFTLGDPKNSDSANRFHTRTDTEHVETFTMGVSSHNLDTCNCFSNFSDIDDNDKSKNGIVQNIFHHGDCFHIHPEIANDGLSQDNAVGYPFADYNCFDNLLAMDSHLVSHLLVTDTNFVDTDCADNSQDIAFSGRSSILNFSVPDHTLHSTMVFQNSCNIATQAVCPDNFFDNTHVQPFDLSSNNSAQLDRFVTKFLYTTPLLQLPRSLSPFQSLYHAKLVKGKYLLRQFRLSKSRLQLDFIPDELPAIQDNTVHKVILTLLPDTVLQDIANLVNTHRKVILKRTNRHLRQCMQSVTIDRTLYFDLDQEFVNSCADLDYLLVESRVATLLEVPLFSLVPQPLRYLIIKTSTWSNINHALSYESSRVFAMFQNDERFRYPVTEPSISAQELLTRRFRHYRRIIHPDRSTLHYHPALHRFLHSAFSGLTYAYELLKEDLADSIPDLVADSDDDDNDSAPDTDDDDDADNDYRPLQLTAVLTTDNASLQLEPIVPPSALPLHLESQFSGGDSDSMLALIPDSDSDSWPDFVSCSGSDTNSLPDLINESYLNHDSDSDSHAPTLRLRRIQWHDPHFQIQSHPIPAPRVPDNISETPCVRCLHQVSPHFNDRLDFSDHFQPATELSRLQRIDRTVFNLGHQGMYVVTVHANYPPIGSITFQYFLDRNQDNLRCIFTILADKFDCRPSDLQVHDIFNPSNSDRLSDHDLHPKHYSDICSDIAPRPLVIDLMRPHQSSLALGHIIVECVGPLHNLEGQHTYAINLWYPPFLFNTMLHLPAVDDSIANRIFLITLAPTSTAMVAYKRTECSAHTTFGMVKHWIQEQLSSIYPQNLIAPSQQMQFYNHFPVHDDILLQQLAGQSTAILDVLSTSSLSHHDEFGVSRLCFCRYTVQLLPPPPPPVDPDVRDRREQDRSYPRISARPPREYSSLSDANFSQTDILAHMPVGTQIRGYQTDRPNFHGYILRFCAHSTVSHQYSNVESLEFDNMRGIRHVRWLIAQATAIFPAQLEFRSAMHPWITQAFNNSATLGELCDICAQVRNDHLTVHAIPSRGRSHILGMITIERVGTLRPQFLPPYAPDSFGFVESVQDFDESQQYYQPVHTRLPSRSINQDSYEILLHLPFVPSIVIRHVISADTRISDLHSWFTEQFDQYHTMSVTTENNQLHFCQGHVLYSDTCYGLLDIRPTQPIFIVSRQSFCSTTSTGYTRLFSGHYFVRRLIDFSRIIPDSHKPDANIWTQSFDRNIQAGLNDNVFTFVNRPSNNNTYINSAQPTSNSSNSDNVHHASLLSSANRREPMYSFALDHADQHRINMFIAGSLIAKDSTANLLMADSGCEISVLPTDRYFISKEYRRTEILTAKTDCSIISQMRGIVEIPVRDSCGQIILLTLSPCLMTPECDIPLMSIATLISMGYKVQYTQQFSGILVDDDVMIPFTRIRNMWFLQIVDGIVSPLSVAMKLNRLDLKTIIQWHLALAHASHRVTYETAKISKGLPALPLSDHVQCPICIQSKMRARNCPPASTTRTSSAGDLIHYDIYFLDKTTLVSQFLDDYTSYKWAYVHRYRTADIIKNIFNQFFASIKSIRRKSTDQPIRIARLRSDNGKELTGEVITTLCSDNHIHRELTCTYTAEQNGRAERGNGTTSTLNRSMLLTSHILENDQDLATTLKEYSIYHAICVENRLYSQVLSDRLGRSLSPYLALYEEQPNFAYIFPFGCAAYYYLPKSRNPAWKTNARGIPAIYLGFGDFQGRKAFVLCNPKTRTIHASVHVKVDPTYFPCRPLGYQRLDSWDSMHPHNIVLHPQSASTDSWISEDLLSIAISSLDADSIIFLIFCIVSGCKLFMHDKHTWIIGCNLSPEYCQLL